MKIFLAALNSKYIHSNLAIRYLEKSIVHMEKDIDVTVKEFTINQNIDYIVRKIYEDNPDVLCFSCYIWNIDIIKLIIKQIKKVMPGLIIILGGPEVSFETKELMNKNDDIDIVIIGEGEEIFNKLIFNLTKNEDYSLIPGIAFRVKGNIVFTDIAKTSLDMGRLPFPYLGETLDPNKIIYYESSRGCPYNCQYCLSSSDSGVRFLPLDRVKSELQYFIDQGVKQVKFIDRTFNAKKDYALEIMKFILDNHKGKTNFHFEVTADLIDDHMLKFLKNIPVGLFQFEIGIQSTNEETLNAVDRNMNFERLSRVVREISNGENIHQHLDLIVGLPEEDYFSFRKSFEDAFELRPEKLQVGFLKLLKGSGLRINADKYGYIYSDNAPYEIMETDWLYYGELLKLKGLEEMVETYWNSDMFNNSIEFIISNFYSSSFKFFEQLWEYWHFKKHDEVSHSKNKLYEILVEFYIENKFEQVEVLKEILKLDFLKNSKTSSIPSSLNKINLDGFKNKCHEFLQKEENIKMYLPIYQGMAAKQIIKQVHFEPFSFDIIELNKKDFKLENIKADQIVLLFDYEIENKALQNCKYYKVNLEK